jgi:hypothetical protein
MQMTDTPDADTYMEICAALMNMMGVKEVFIQEKHFQNTPFEIWRAFENADIGGLRVKLEVDAPVQDSADD